MVCIDRKSFITDNMVVDAHTAIARYLAVMKLSLPISLDPKEKK